MRKTYINVLIIISFFVLIFSTCVMVNNEEIVPMWLYPAFEPDGGTISNNLKLINLTSPGLSILSVRAKSVNVEPDITNNYIEPDWSSLPNILTSSIPYDGSTDLTIGSDPSDDISVSGSPRMIWLKVLGEENKFFITLLKWTSGERWLIKVQE